MFPGKWREEVKRTSREQGRRGVSCQAPRSQRAWLEHGQEPPLSPPFLASVPGPSASLPHFPDLTSLLRHHLLHSPRPNHLFSIPSSHPSLLFPHLLPSSPQTLLLPCPTPAGLSEQEPLHLHFSGHCLANGLLICSIVPCEANSISASQSSLPVDSVIDWRNSCHRPAARSLPPSAQVRTTPPPRAAAPRPQRQRTPATCPRICRQQ